MNDDAPVAREESPIRDVFLSPRVIDQGAFDEYGTRLRELVDQLSTSAQTLRQAIEDAARARRDLESIAQEDRARIDAAHELMATLDERTKRLEHAIERSDKLESLSETFERHADRSLGARVSELEKHMAQSTSAFARQLKGHLDAHTTESEALLARTRSARQQIAQQSDQIAQRALNSLRETCDRAEYLAGRQKEKDGRAATGSLAQMIERAESALTSIEKSESRARDLGATLECAVGELHAQIETVRRERGAQESMLSETAALIHETKRNLGEEVERADESNKALESQIDDARILESALSQRASEGSSTLRALESAHARSIDEREQLALALESLAPWGEVLLEDSVAISLPRPVAEFIGQMRGELSKDLRALARAMQDVAGHAADAHAPRILVEPKLTLAPVSEASPLACGAD